AKSSLLDGIWSPRHDALTGKGIAPISVPWHSSFASANSLTLRPYGLISAESARNKFMAKTKFRPLHDRVVVKRIEAEDKSKGGIIIPDTAKEKPQEGEIIAVGPGGRE